MKIVVGLGNPGPSYRHTRHNVGSSVVQELVRRSGGRVARLTLAWVSRGTIAGEEVVLARPRTYMNDSGRSVQSLVHRYSVHDLADLLIVVDDMDLPLGTLRLRRTGSDGGHNGLKSIIQALGSREFPRLRIGVGRPVQGVDPIEHVLDGFTPGEREGIARAESAAIDAIACWMELGITEAMNRFNSTRVDGETGP